MKHGRLAVPALLGLLAACASGPPVPDWQIEARSALERANGAYLEGNPRVATVEFARARAAVAGTARVDLVARVELARCAAQVASLDFTPCAAFEPLRADAAPAEQAYADHLFGKLDAARVPLLPAPQQAAARAAVVEPAALQSIEDPLSRLVAASVALRTNRLPPAGMAVAVETASAQGWRRPLLAWLRVLQQRAADAGDSVEAERIARRIALLMDAAPAPAASAAAR